MANKKIMAILICIFLMYTIQNNIFKYNFYITENNSTPIASQKEEWFNIWDKYNIEYGHGIAIDDTTGYLYITGYNLTLPPGGYGDAVLLSKFSSSGICIWNTTWDPGDYNYGYDVAIDNEGFVYVVGATKKEGNYDAVLIKFDQDGNEIWNETWGAIESDYALALTIDSENNIYVTGYTYNGINTEDVFILKYNSSSSLQWSDIWGYGFYNKGYDIAIDQQGNIYITGVSKVPYDYLLMLKYNSSGDIDKSKVFGPSNYDEGRAIAIDSNNNIFVSGFSNYSGNYDVLLVQFNQNLDSNWYKIWAGSSFDQAYCIDIDSNNSIYIGGITYQDGNGKALLLKYNTSGDLQWNQIWDGNLTDSIRKRCMDIAIDSTNNIYATGDLYELKVPVEDSRGDIFLLKFSQESEPSNGDKKGFEIPGYDLLIFTAVIILILTGKIRKHKK